MHERNIIVCRTDICACRFMASIEFILVFVSSSKHRELYVEEKHSGERSSETVKYVNR